MTIATLILTCLLFVGLGWTGDIYSPHDAGAKRVGTSEIGDAIAALNQAALEIAGRIFTPGIFHAHDWPAGLLAPYLRETRREPRFARCAMIGRRITSCDEPPYRPR